MPSQNRNRQAKAAAEGGAKRRSKRKRSPARKTGPRPPRRPDPSDADDTETRFIQPYEAAKHYLCPGCNQEIPPGMGHLVAVPRSAPDLRRHWHRGCWTGRSTRR